MLPALAASLVLAAFGAQEQEPPSPDEERAIQDMREAATYAAIEDEQTVRARSYTALVHEVDLYQEFRSYLQPGYMTLQEGRGMITDKIKLNARLRNELAFDTNLFLAPDDEISDVIE